MTVNHFSVLTTFLLGGVAGKQRSLSASLVLGLGQGPDICYEKEVG